MAKKKTRVLLPGGIQGLVHDLQSGKPTNVAPVEPEKDNSSLEGEKNDTQNQQSAQAQQSSDNQQNNAAGSQNGQNAQQQTSRQQQPSDYQSDRVSENGPQRPYPTPSENRAQSSNAVPSAENANGGRGSEGQNGTHTYDARRGEQNRSGQQSGNGQPSEERQTPIGGELPGRSYSPGRPPKKDTMKEYHIVKDDSRDSWDLFLDMAKQYKDGGGKLATIYIDSSLKNVLDRMKYVGPEKLPTSAILSSIVARFIYDHEEDIRKALYNDRLI